ncbi:MAG TPA: hypothetical protein DCE11_00680 [Ruminiclostridium sp.]|jgi:uncharacterized Zn ribbon protein|nr:hypothetical protein [Clostridiaceae bacterium]HAA24619.1 hypothetical protein [Ruminiclostridium sp.]
MIVKNKTNTSRLLFKLFILIVLITVVVFSAMYAFDGSFPGEISWEIFNPAGIIEKVRNNRDNGQSGVIFSGDIKPKLAEMYMGNLLILSESDIKLFNSKGEEMWYIPHEMHNPVVNVHDKLILLYEQTGKAFVVISNGRTLLKDKLDEEIAFGYITDHYILFISRSNIGYKRTVHMIEPESGINLGALYIDDYYPYYAIPQSGEKNTFLLYGLGLDSIYPSTVIREYGTDINPSPVTGIELNDITPLFRSNGSMKLFIGERSAYCYDDDFTLIWSRDFDKNIVSAGMFDNGASVFVLEDYHNDIAVFVDKQGKDVKDIKLNGQVHDIETYGNSAAVVMGSEIIFYGHSGKQNDNVTIPGMKIKVKFIDEKRAYLVSEHEIILHNISKNK